MTITEIKRLNKKAGNRFFDRGAMQFFNSKVYPRTFDTPQGTLFVTGERRTETPPLRYTLRCAERGGKIQTMSKFQEYATLREAYTAAEVFAHTEKP